MILIRAIMFLMLFTFIPFALGRLITYRANTNWIGDYFVGFFGNLAIFYVLFCLFEWIQNWITYNKPVTGAFTLLLKAYCIVIAILLVVWAIKDIKNIKSGFQKMKTGASNLLQEIKCSKLTIIYTVAFIGIIIYQLYMAYGYEINEWSYDDYDYVVVSKDTISSDTLSYTNFIDGSLVNIMEKRAVTSWMTYISMLSVVSNFEVTTVCHTIMPVVIMLLAYLNFYYIAKFLFKDLENRMIFMLILSVVYMFGLYSHYSSTFRLMGAIWQGKAVLSVLAVPFFMMYLLEVYQQDVKTAYMLPIAAVSLGACSLTSLSVLFVTIEAVFIWMIMCIYHRKLYGIRYLLASLIGPGFLGCFYYFVTMLQKDMASWSEDKFYSYRRRNDWWYNVFIKLFH